MLTLFILSTYSHISTKLIRKIKGPSTKEIIDQLFVNAIKQDYEVLILGNSKMAQGINPDKFDLPTYNFAHNNDSYNQIYHKLIFLEKNNKKFKILLLGVDYFDFSNFSDTRNSYLKKYFSPEYFEDYKTPITKVIEYKNQLNKKFNRNLSIKYSLTFPIFLETILFPITKNDSVTYLKENGQLIEFNGDGIGQFEIRDYNILQIQFAHYYKILNYCRTKNINLFLVMPPTKSKELESYPPQVLITLDSIFYNTAKEYNFPYLNYSKNQNFAKPDDYLDKAHLSHQAANKFSDLLNDTIVHSLY